MILKRQCPKCGGRDFKIEKSPDGRTQCTACGFTAPHMNFYVRIPEEITERVTKETLVGYLMGRISEIQSTMVDSTPVYELLKHQEEINTINRLITYVQENTK